MGKGDKRTTRGKLFKGSHGKSRSPKTNRPVRPKAKRGARRGD